MRAKVAKKIRSAASRSIKLMSNPMQKRLVSQVIQARGGDRLGIMRVGIFGLVNRRLKKAYKRSRIARSSQGLSS